MLFKKKFSFLIILTVFSLIFVSGCDSGSNITDNQAVDTTVKSESEFIGSLEALSSDGKIVISADLGIDNSTFELKKDSGNYSIVGIDESSLKTISGNLVIGNGSTIDVRLANLNLAGTLIVDIGNGNLNLNNVTVQNLERKSAGDIKRDNIPNSSLEYGTFLDLSAGNGTLNVDSPGNELLAVLYSGDDSGGDYDIGSFDTDYMNNSVANLSSQNLSSQNLISTKSEQNYLYDGSEDEFLKEMEAEALKNHRSSGFIQSLGSLSEPLIGDIESFNIYKGETKEFGTINAELREIGEHVLIWTDNSINTSANDLQKMKEEFDNHIYSDVKYSFGEDPQVENFEVLRNAGEKVNIVITSLLTSSGEPWAGGYFYSIDLYSKTQYSNSNERKIMYIHNYEDQNLLDYQIGTIAHEFQHMIFYNQRVINNNRLDNATWLNEGFSQLAQDLVGYGYKDGIANDLTGFLNDPENTSLLLWEGQHRDYNISYLFARYLYDRFGAGIIDGVHAIGGTYKNAVAEYTGMSFRSLFRDFAFAIWIDDDNSSKYGFPVINFPRPKANVISAGESWNNQQTRGWGINYTLIENSSLENITIDVTGADYGSDFYLDVLK